jgi:hypothetical protein
MDSLYSCFINDAESIGGGDRTFDLFTYMRSQHVAGWSHSPVVATQVHTNVPRSGGNGLPTGWAMIVDRWRATVNMRFLNDVILDWAAHTSLELFYSARSVATTPLIDILMAPHPLSDPSGNAVREERLRRGEIIRPEPLVFREHLNYYVHVQTRHDADRLLRTWLVEHAIELQEKERSVDTSTWKPRLLCWIWLEGVLTRAAM